MATKLAIKDVARDTIQKLPLSESDRLPVSKLVQDKIQLLKILDCQDGLFGSELFFKEAIENIKHRKSYLDPDEPLTFRILLLICFFLRRTIGTFQFRICRYAEIFAGIGT